jgi:hypothetical protein
MAKRSHAAHTTPDDQYVTTPPEAGYEHTDARVDVIGRFMVWLAVAAVVIHVGLWLVFMSFVEQRVVTTEPDFPLAVGQEPRLPAEPRLQQYPRLEYMQFRAREEEILESYGWVAREAGTVRIPIAEAMRLVLERGLPATAEAPADGSPPGLEPSDSSSGRMMERRR